MHQWLHKPRPNSRPDTCHRHHKAPTAIPNNSRSSLSNNPPLITTCRLVEIIAMLPLLLRFLPTTHPSRLCMRFTPAMVMRIALVPRRSSTRLLLLTTKLVRDQHRFRGDVNRLPMITSDREESRRPLTTQLLLLITDPTLLLQLRSTSHPSSTKVKCKMATATSNSLATRSNSSSSSSSMLLLPTTSKWHITLPSRLRRRPRSPQWIFVFLPLRRLRRLLLARWSLIRGSNLRRALRTPRTSSTLLPILYPVQVRLP